MGKKTIISIEGIIGCGKTSLLQQIECPTMTQSRITTIYEPVDEWRNFNGTNVLQEFYNDPEKNGLGFQLFVANTFIKRMEESINLSSDLVITDRCALSGIYQFTKLFNSIVSLDYVYKSLVDLVERAVEPYRPTVIVYIKVDIDTAMERICKRGRDEEKKISKEYQTQLKNHIESWLDEERARGTKVVVLDGSKSSKEVYEEFCLNLL